MDEAEDERVFGSFDFYADRGRARPELSLDLDQQQMVEQLGVDPGPGETRCGLEINFESLGVARVDAVGNALEYR